MLYQGRWVGSEERAALGALDHARRANELERLRSEIQLESARLQADRAAASMSYGGDYDYYDPYNFGVPYPYAPFYGYGGGVLTGGRFDRGLSRPSRPLRRWPSVRPPRSPGSVDGRFQGGLHHQGGQPRVR